MKYIHIHIILMKVKCDFILAVGVHAANCILGIRLPSVHGSCHRHPQRRLAIFISFFFIEQMLFLLHCLRLRTLSRYNHDNIER